MATKNKKRNRRPTVPGPSRTAGSSSPSSGTGSATRASAGPNGPSVPVAPAQPGGPNRLARKEEARRQREALRRKQARRRYYRIGGVALAIVVALAAIATITVINNSNKKKNVQVAVTNAGCGPVQTIAPYPTASDDRAHIGAAGANGEVSTAPPLSSYRTQPPTSGPHNPVPLNAGVYSSPPDVYSAIHALEHGAVIIWYSPTAPSTLVSQLSSYYKEPSHSDHVIVAPYNYPTQGTAGQLPAGKQMVLVAWHHMRQCGKVSLDATKDFVDHYRTPTGQTAPSGYLGDAPEPGLAI